MWTVLVPLETIGTWQHQQWQIPGVAPDLKFKKFVSKITNGSLSTHIQTYFDRWLIKSIFNNFEIRNIGRDTSQK